MFHMIASSISLVSNLNPRDRNMSLYEIGVAHSGESEADVAYMK